MRDRAVWANRHQPAKLLKNKHGLHVCWCSSPLSGFLFRFEHVRMDGTHTTLHCLAESDGRRSHRAYRATEPDSNCFCQNLAWQVLWTCNESTLLYAAKILHSPSCNLYVGPFCAAAGYRQLCDWLHRRWHRGVSQGCGARHAMGPAPLRPMAVLWMALGH